MIAKLIPEGSVTAIRKLIGKSDKIIIIPHKGPDGDAIGACLALYHFLHTIDREAIVIAPDRFSDNLDFMPSSSEILFHNEEIEKTTALVADADLILCLDFNMPSRAGELGAHIKQSEAKKVVIDHHPLNSEWADITVSHPEIASTAELIFRLICRFGYFAEMTKETAECICVGMLTDTGGLAYNSNKAEMYTIFSELIGKGVDKDAIYRKLFSNNSANRMKLMGYVLSEKMDILPEYNTSIIALHEEELKQFNYKKGDVEGFVNMPLSIKGIIFSVFIKNEAGKVKISFRSVGNFPANQFSDELFGGGGHKNAAGAESQVSVEKTVEKIKNALPAFIEKLNQ